MSSSGKNLAHHAPSMRTLAEGNAMTNDLVAALREAREFVRKRYLAMGDKEANELIARLDAALSAASGEATSLDNDELNHQLLELQRSILALQLELSVVKVKLDELARR